MKKILLIAIVLICSNSLTAQYREDILRQLVWDDEKLSILIDTRIDLEQLIQKGHLENLTFRGQTVRLWLVGEIVPGFRYRIRHRLNSGSSVSARDNYAGATDHAWLQFDIGKSWTITAGKQGLQIGTYENDYNGADVYLGTMIFNDLDASMTGVTVSYKFLQQVLNFQVTNSDDPQFSNEAYKNKALAFNVLWVGHLFDGIINTRWGYGTFQHSRTKFYNWVTLGTQINIGRFTTEFDYYTGNRNMDYSSIVSMDSLGYRYVHDQSISLHMEYNFGKWRPFVKGIWDKRYDKGFGHTAYRSLGIQAVAEYYPFSNERLKDLRFHAAYAYKNTDFRGVYSYLDNTAEHLIIVGTRWMFKAK